MADNKTYKLVHPDGKREYTTADRSEITDLRARGYKLIEPAPKPASKSTAKN